ncbi:DUF3606 domain-containing protein [Sphingomonas sp. CLY1604]|uniref:DUF3606 domain-containing protein n=1 Tax=Sphingomonas sp. CLY1604 TaxID=3457786 RepID=UPI003FD76969
MSDNLNIRRPADASRVNVHETWEVEYWTKKFGVTKTQLENAVKTVGTSAAAVARHLGKTL